MRFDHLVIEVVALARALADAGEHRVAAVRLGDVVDQLHDQHRLAHASTAEQADLAALGVRCEQVHDLDAGDQDRGLRRLVGEAWCRLVDGALGRGLDGAGLVDRLADHVHDATQAFIAHWYRDGLAGVGHVLAAHQTLGAVHGDGAYRVLAEVLGYLEHQALTVIAGFERVQDLGQVSVELHVDDGAHHLADFADLVRSHVSFLVLKIAVRAPRRRR